MNTKLTLSADPVIIAVAKETATRQHISVSRMFARFIEAMQDISATDNIAPITQRASGILNLPSDKTDSQLIEDALSERL